MMAKYQPYSNNQIPLWWWKGVCNESVFVRADEEREEQRMTYEQKSAIIISQLRADRDRLQNIIEQIRAEIERHRRKTQGIDTYDLVGDCLDIIDKYKAENEE
jgi:hypothetical protein